MVLLVCCCLGGLAGVRLVYEKYFLGHLIAGRPLLMLALLLLILGAQFVFFGLLGEMLVHLSDRQAVLFRVRKKL